MSENTSTILLTGGRGAVATHLLALLHAGGHPVRVASRAPERLRVPAGVPAIACDLRDPATFPAALSGVGAVFLYAEAARIGEFVDAAVTAGVQHIVLLSSASVLGPGAAGDPLARAHLDVETALLAAPIATTLLRPGSFASNAAAWSWPIRAGRPVSLPYPDAHTDPLHERDLAEAARTVLTDPRHRGGHFHLTGPQSLTFRRQLDMIGAITGRSATIAHVSPQEWKREMSEHIPGPYADALVDFWRSYDGRPVPLTDAVERLTGHTPRTFATWVGDHVADFTG
ncbi:NAD(P)H-binding protein [Sphaerisporangium sp. NPDC005289]|uniref:SDR family oxidoreductase n=1 Tax=Sphaerisporangium sp. NPDC005289 TaxID=3155247 RepID=UPI0033B7F5D2